MADAKGAFVTRALEKLLKDSAGRKYVALQKASKAYLERPRSKGVPASTATPAATPPGNEPAALDHAPSSEEMHDVALTSPRTPVAGTPGAKPPSVPSSPAVTSPPGSPGPALGAASSMTEAGMQLSEKDAELVLLPLKLACESKQPKLVETALDCLHKLIAYGHLEGEAGLEAGGNSKINTELFQMVCASADIPNDSVVLQVIKVLLTSVASSTFKVHGECLLLAIRTCYNIALGSKSPINQATAKATLTQMINLVFQRMDPEYKEAGPKSNFSPAPSPYPPSSPRGAKSHPPSLHLDEQKSKSAEKAPASENGAVKEADHEPETASPPRSPGPAPLQVKSSEATPDEAPSSPPPTSPSAAVSIEELSHLAGDADIKGLEAALDKAVHPEGVPAGQHGPEGAGPLDQHSLSQAERNALMVFRTLCKLSMAEPKSPSEADIITRGRLLSLELLQALLESAGKGFPVAPCFVEALKSYLPYALLRASVTPSAPVFERAASLFAVLLLRFRDHLKAEIGIFFPLIVLRSLDLGDSPLHQRVAVLKSLQTTFADPQTVLDFFVNYDCDLDSTNLFERAVKSLSRIAQGVPGSDPGSIALAQNTGLKASSLHVLVNILQSLLVWTRRGQAASIAAISVAADDAEKQDGDDTEDSSQAAQLVKDKTQKSLIEAAVVEFNLKPDKGIKLLEKQGILAHEPVAIAKFLHQTPGLNKTLIGEYLGHHEEFHIKVMHAYVDELSFKGLIFDDAIRRFLSGFRLPGEAQKIDRLMEKFAERYCKDNPGTFKNADTAYVLAYAVIMLNTDAHNPMVWPKMSKSDFVRINSSSGQPGTEDNSAPVELLEDLYDRIVNNEIKLKDEGANPGGVSKAPVSAGPLGVLNLALPRGRNSTVETTGEGDEIVRRTQALFKTQQHGKVFQKATEVGLARPILEAVGWALLAAFSVTMEDSDNKPRVALCMEGFRLGVQLTKVLRMETMRNAFLTSMVRLTSLHAPREMRTKNVEALRVLLQMAQQEPDSLQDAWYSVLECISRLEELANNPAAQSQLLPGGNQPSRVALIHGIQELAGMPTEGVFVNSNRLPSDAIVEFFTALCKVSEGELSITPPRVFSLQKLVEISYYNITRIRLVWARIWAVLSSHFIAAGEHNDEEVAMYAIDSLRQLGIKYLERAELANFTFQNDIMKPFVVIMRGSRSERIRELITQCIVQMIKSKVSSIKSGWRSVFMVFTTAAQDTSESIVDSAFLNVEQVVLEHFDQVVGDCFMDCVNCLIAFANNKLSASISLKAIALLRICEDRLAEGHIPGGNHRPVEEAPKKSDKEVAEYYWFPMLAGLSELTSDPRPDVRSCALEVLFDLLNERGASFSTPFWESVFQRVLFPIFDYVRHAGAGGHKKLSANEWLRDTCIHCLQLLCDLFSKFYTDVSFLLPNLLGLLLDCATRPDQALAAISVAALVRLMDIGGHALSESDWGRLLHTIRDTSDATRPIELLQPESLGNFGPPLPSGEGSSSRRSSLGDGQVTPIRLSTVEEPREGPRLERVAEDGSFKGEREIVSTPSEPSVAAPQSPEGEAGTSEEPAQSAAQTMVGRMMSTLLMRNMSFSRKGRADAQVVAPRPPPDEGGTYLDTLGPEDAIEFSNEKLDAVRCKCVIQLLLLDALHKAQSEHWDQLSPANKRALLEITQGLVDFASKYNSDVGLRQKLQLSGSEKAPPSLLRQEVDGTGLYLAITFEILNDKSSDAALLSEAEARFVGLAERVLGEASALQTDRDDSTRTHETLGLKAPVTVQVLSALQTVAAPVFKRHFEGLYPHLTTLIGSDQLDVRRALANLFSARLGALLPSPK